ncbi:MAG: class I tRNA ligase family protein [Candidatus Nanoperiomorbaceae bacterium]
MKFKANSRRSAAEYEKDWVGRWKKDKAFEKSVENRDADSAYVFYDGPPFITGVPHYGTLLSSIVKDAVPRYWTMKGKRVERRWGWDCHGLPAENFVEKQLGIVDHRQILTDDRHRFEPIENVPASGINAHLNITRLSKKEWNDTTAKLAPHNEKTGETLPVISLEKYIETAHQSMKDNSETWKPIVDRIGRWVDMSQPYRTMNPDFMESVWWAFKKFYDAGKIYEGAKVLMYDTHFATPVAKAEVTMDNDAYQKVTDPSVYVKFRLENSVGMSGENIFSQLVGGLSKNDVEFNKNLDWLDDYLRQDKPIYMLAWTTTPWTLPGNTALAVNSKMQYSLVRSLGEGEDNSENVFIIAHDLVAKVLGDSTYTILATFSGSKLVGLSYDPLFDFSVKETHGDLSKIYDKCLANYYENDIDSINKIWSADYVSDESGTGVVHIAPIYGEDDYELGKQNHIPARETMDENGFYWPAISAKLDEIFKQSFGENYREILKKAEVKTDKNGSYEAFSSNKMIAKALEKTGFIWKIEMIRHEYPFNPRSKQRIMYRAIPSWFFDVAGEKPLLLSQNENINWFPEHLKHGRFAKNIEQAPDWNLSRDRFWATAMPIWKGDRGSIKVIGSYAELKELSGVELDDYHRPWVDNITFEIDGEHFSRIDKVLDGWFESGSMPFAQLHYPFENQENFEQNYPADFIVEYIGQVRAWFYYVHVVNTTLADIGAFGQDRRGDQENAFKNVITTGVIAGNDGRKMSKSLGNFTDPNELMDKFSADSLRFLLLSSPLLNGEDFTLKDKDVSDVSRKLNMIWNMYDFFTMYAEVDGWQWNEKSDISLAELKNPLDIWIVSRLHQLIAAVERNMNAYNIPEALAPVIPFLDDASNWFVRRSRRRFWKNENATDKDEAFRTLHYVLLRLSYVLAPFTPFLAEELYRDLTDDSESIHLKNWWPAGEIDDKVLADMARTRELIANGLALRMQKDENQAALKIRQPLALASYAGTKLSADYEQIMLEELNVKRIDWVKNLDKHLAKYDKVEGKIDPETWLEISKKLTTELKREGLAREIIRAVQSARKAAKLNVDDRIILELETTDDELRKALDEFNDLIAAETLATDMFGVNKGHETNVKISGYALTIRLVKVD